MLKGTNRRIIEINKTGNDYFEKAILFVKTDKTEYPTSTLQNQADEYISKLCTKDNKKTNKYTVIFTVLFLIMIAVIVLMVKYL